MMIKEHTQPFRLSGDSDCAASAVAFALSEQGRHAKVMISVLHSPHIRVEL